MSNDLVIKVCINRTEFLRLLDIEKQYEKLKSEHNKCLSRKTTVLQTSGGGEIKTSSDLDSCRVLAPDPGVEDPDLLTEPPENPKLPVHVLKDKDIDYHPIASSSSAKDVELNHGHESHEMNDSLLIHGIWDRYKRRYVEKMNTNIYSHLLHLYCLVSEQRNY